MAEIDWALVDGSAAEGVITHKSSPGFPKPPGVAAGAAGCSYAFVSRVDGPNAVAKYLNLPGWAPGPSKKGGSMSGAMLVPSTSTGASIFLFCALARTPGDPPPEPPPVMSSIAYMLGMTATGRVILRKGRLDEGLPDVEPGTQGVLARSTEVFTGFKHLKLEVSITNIHWKGEAVLHAHSSDIPSWGMLNPAWEQIAGMPMMIDDLLGIHTGSLPLVGGGYTGFGFHATAAGKVAYMGPYITPLRQLV